MPRITTPSEATMTAEQLAVFSEVAAGPRGKVPMPMTAWLLNPDLADRAQQLGASLRFHSTLDNRSIEVAVLTCACHWSANPVLKSHKEHARKAGLAEEVVAAIEAGRMPSNASDKERVVFRLSMELFEDHRISDATYADAIGEFGERGVVELVALLGYYCLVALTVNAFELGTGGDTTSEPAEARSSGDAGR